MHWADVIATKLAEKGDTHVIASGITPSGEFHIGHLREILTADIISRACKSRGMNVEFVFIVDSADPLRKVYDFLDPAYESYIGHQLGRIPAPDADGKPGDGSTSYTEHFLGPFLNALSQIGVTPTVVDNLQCYNDGNFAEAAKLVCDNVDNIREIIERVSGRELAADWFPYNPLGSDGSMDGVTVTGYEWPNVHWVDGVGGEGSADIRTAEGKLPWRLDWPARWGFHGISCEPFGKDHGAAGGSYDTGREVALLLGNEPPMPLTYEWISLKGVGAMSSSTGVSIGPLEALRLVPPEILRYLIARNKPNRHIDFDTGASLIELADEYQRRLTAPPPSAEEYGEMSRRQKVALEDIAAQLLYSRIREEDEGDTGRTVSFRHLGMLAQVRANDADVWGCLVGSGHIGSADDPPADLADRLFRMRAWIGSEHFPEEFRLNIQSKPTSDALQNIDSDSIPYLSNLRDALADCKWDEVAIHDQICNEAKNIEMRLSDAFKILYWLILDDARGPKLASIIAQMDRADVVGLLDSVIAELH